MITTLNFTKFDNVNKNAALFFLLFCDCYGVVQFPPSFLNMADIFLISSLRHYIMIPMELKQTNLFGLFNCIIMSVVYFTRVF